MYEIDLVDSQTRLTLDPQRLCTIAEDVLRHEGVAGAAVNIALVDGGTMRRLNRQHLNHDYDTDVLSFLLEFSGPEPENPSDPAVRRGEGKSLEGEVIISTDMAAKVAEEFHWPAEAEVILYLVHGVLHLIGYDDLSDEEAPIMRHREREHLARWELTPVFAQTDAGAKERLMSGLAPEAIHEPKPSRE